MSWSRIVEKIVKDLDEFESDVCKPQDPIILISIKQHTKVFLFLLEWKYLIGLSIIIWRILSVA